MLAESNPDSVDFRPTPIQLGRNHPNQAAGMPMLFEIHLDLAETTPKWVELISRKAETKRNRSKSLKIGRTRTCSNLGRIQQQLVERIRRVVEPTQPGRDHQSNFGTTQLESHLPVQSMRIPPKLSTFVVAPMSTVWPLGDLPTFSRHVAKIGPTLGRHSPLFRRRLVGVSSTPIVSRSLCSPSGGI